LGRSRDVRQRIIVDQDRQPGVTLNFTAVHHERWFKRLLRWAMFV
jgi:hypothetical protein